MVFIGYSIREHGMYLVCAATPLHAPWLTSQLQLRQPSEREQERLSFEVLKNESFI